MTEALLAHATETINVGSKSFAAAARLFDPATRRSVLMLYAWCRHCDDAVDGQELGHNIPNALPHDPARALALLESETRRAYAGEPMTDPDFAAFQEVALRHAMPSGFAFDHLAGFAMDVQGARYETIDDLLRYCYHVAGVVGLMMASIMGVKDPDVLDRACDLGLAFQLTNVARDIVEDAGVGRCYVPAAWLREAGIAPYYDSASSGVAALPLRSAWAIATARNVYRQIGIEVKRRGVHAWDERAGTTKAMKLWLLAKGGVAALASRLGSGSVKPRPANLWLRPGRAGAAAHHGVHAAAV
jgi:phytoene synthase